MPDCDKYIELISASLDGACSPAEAAELEVHLAQCPTCKALYDDLKTIHDTLSALPAAEPPADLKDRVMAAIAADNVTPLPVKKKTATPWKRWGATAAAVLLVAIGAWGLNQNSVSRDSLPVATPAAAFSDQGNPAMFRSAPAPETTTDTEAMIEGYSTDGLNAPTSGETAPTVDATYSAEAVESIPTQEPGISLFTPSAPTLFASVPSEAPALTAGEALDLLLAEKAFEDYERVNDTAVTWPRNELWQDHLVYDAISENGRYYVFILFRNVYDSAEDDLPSNNSRCCAYAVALDGSEILEETGPEFWDALSKE